MERITVLQKSQYGFRSLMTKPEVMVMMKYSLRGHEDETLKGTKIKIIKVGYFVLYLKCSGVKV